MLLEGMLGRCFQPNAYKSRVFPVLSLWESENSVVNWLILRMMSVKNVRPILDTNFGPKCLYDMDTNIHNSFSLLLYSQMTMSGNHYLMLTTVGDLYSWGSNEAGQLGMGNRVSQVGNDLISTVLRSDASGSTVEPALSATCIERPPV